MKSFLAGVLGGFVGAIGVAVAQFATISAGLPISPIPLTDAQDTKMTVTGSILLGYTTVGPGFGSGVCGIGYRQTRERLMDPSLVMRCHSYQFENDGPHLRWEAIISDRGMAVGVQPEDAYPYPIDRFNVSRGNIAMIANTQAEESCIVSRVGGEPVWMMGRCPKSFGTGDDFVIFKWKSGVWYQVARWAY